MSRFIFDGAFATYYETLYNESCANAYQYPRRIIKIHQEYLQAGCNAIKTHTFGLNESVESFKEIKHKIKIACDCAKEAINGYEAKIYADLGPLVATREEKVYEQYQKLVDVFIEEGITNFLFETLASDEGIYDICHYLKAKVSNAHIIVSYALSGDGYTKLGKPLTKLIEGYRKCEAIDVIGLNCICGPTHMSSLARFFDFNQDVVAMMPNAGYPSIQERSVKYQDNAQYYATIMQEIANKGVSILGGCCGTTPYYMELVKEMCEHLTYADISDEEAMDKITSNHQNHLLNKLKQGKKIVAVEFDPPNNCDISKFMANAAYLKEHGVDAITIADCPIARVRVDSSILACKLKRELQMDMIPHMTCRDRNINATKALLYGLAIEQVDNILVVTGDPIASEDKDVVKAVFNFNSQTLAGYIKELNDTLFPQPFMIFAALNLNAVNFKAELEKAKRKVKQGVVAFLTQPIHTQQAIDNLRLAKQELDAYILAGIMPIVSYRNALFMHNEINGMMVDQRFIDLYEGKSKEEGNELAIMTSCRIVDEIKDDCDGFYLITPFNRVTIIKAIMDHIHTL